MKKIALFSDGTGNSSSSPQKTNVWRAYQALDRSPASHQIAFYDNGVGTSTFRPMALLGLGLGFGLARNVREIYGFVCRTYDPGDEIYGFGFSRGAFTMRVVMALIASQGIIDRNVAADERDLDRMIIYAYRRFRHENFTPSMLSFFFRPLRDLVANTWRRIMRKKLYDPRRNIRNTDEPGDEPLIKFIGVWDTVDAYGLSVDELTRAWDKVVWPLSAKDRDFSPRIGRARQALALDEARESFEPLLWNEHNRPLGKTIDDEQVSQVWFAGVHSNVGGSYPDDSLAFTALNWMLDESGKNDGLKYLKEERRRYREQADPNGPIYDSRKGLGTFYRYAPRSLEYLCHEKSPGLANSIKELIPIRIREALGLSEVEKNSVDIVKPKLHHSVFKKIAESGDAYAPINLPDDYAVVYDDGKIVDLTSADRRLPETPQQAKDRRTRQAYVWNKVWAGKILYLVTLVVAVLFVVYPRFRDGEPSNSTIFLETIFGTLSTLIRAIPQLIGQIPGLGFAANWAASYDHLPYAFLAFVILISGLLWCSQYLGSRLASEMRANWQPVSRRGPPPADLGGIGKLRTRLAKWLDSRPNGRGEAAWSIGDRVAQRVRIVFEMFGILFLLLLILLVVSRVVLITADGFGGVCEADANQEKRSFGEVFRFDPASTCFDTGLELQRDKRYAIEMRVSDDWSDADIYADVHGWRDKPSKSGPAEMKSPPWYMALALPLRRHLFADWYQPIARVDEELFDRYPLDGDNEEVDDEDAGRQMSLYMEFRAKGTGQLYLYLNDAVLFLPELVELFYKNNRGCALVVVTELAEVASGPDDPGIQRDSQLSLTTDDMDRLACVVPRLEGS